MVPSDSEKSAAQLAVELEEAREQIAKLTRTLDSAPDPIFSFTPEGRYSFANQALAEAFGTPALEIIGKSLWDFFPKEDADRRFASLTQVFRTGQETMVEGCVPHSDGDRYYQTAITPIKDETGKVVSAISTSRNMTEYKQAEELLRASEGRYRLLINNLPDIVYSLDGGGNVVTVNGSALERYGYGEEEVKGKPFLAFVHPEDCEILINSFLTALEEKRSTTTGLQFRIAARNGVSHWFELNAYARFDSGGGYLGEEGVLRDISERKQADAARRVGEARLTEAQRVAHVGSWDRVLATGAISWSEELYRIYGVDPKLPVPSFAEQARFHTPESWERLRAAVERTLHTGTPFKLDVQLVRADGGFTWATTRCEVVRDAEGKIVGTRGTVLDITERKQSEAERDQLEEQLRVSQKMEAIGSLAGGVAHDFNNLLSVILSCTQFAMEAVPEGDPIRSDLAEVKEAGERAAALTRQLLAFSRKQVLQPVPVDLNQIAAGLEKMLRRILGEDIELEQTLAPDLGLSCADPGQIEQVLMNLVVNARDAMPEGGRLTIETSNVDLVDEYAARRMAVTPGPYVQMAVADSGCGMDAQTQARVFEPFFTTKEKGRGTGLGLSTVYGIVKQSGGNISVSSEPGQGTTFRIYLPRDLSAAAATATGSSPVWKQATGTETILVAEDDEALRGVVRRALVDAGYTVLTAVGGDEALEVCAQHTGDISLLLTDVVMPGMSGRVLSEHLAQTRPGLKILYVSGYTSDAIVHHGVLDAGTHFLAKPFTAVALTRKVRDVLDEEPPPRVGLRGEPRWCWATRWCASAPRVPSARSRGGSQLPPRVRPTLRGQPQR